VKKIASLVDRMAVILPFEEVIYRDAGLPTEFVGHPILEEIETVMRSSGLCSNLTAITQETRAYFKTALGFRADTPLLAMLPGSRPSELSRHLPLMADVVRQFKSDPEINKTDAYQVCMPLAPNTDERHYSSSLEELKREGVIIKKGESVKVLAASDMAVVTSGTATLQTALLEVPMVVVYKLSPLTYQLGKLIIDVPYITLVNILAGRGVVPELIQDRANPAEIMKELKNIIFNIKHRQDIMNAYKSIKGPFIGKRASERVAEMVLELAGQDR